MTRTHNYSAIYLAHIREYGGYLDKTMSCSDQRGFVLIGLIITMIIIAVLGTALVHFTTTSTFSELFTNRQQRAYYVAESGGRYAVPQIQSDPVQATTDLHGKTFTLSNGDKFVLSIDNTDPEFAYLTSEGIVHKGDWLEAREKITYKISKGYVFDYGAFSGSQSVILNKQAYIDSYDSRVGPWSEATRNQNGHVGTNRTGNKSIEVKNTAIVYGNATVGPGGDPATDINVDAGAQITGSTGALTATRDMTPKSMPAGGGTPFDLKLDHSETYTFTEGEYRLNKLEIKDDGILTISGHVTLYVEDRIQIEDRGAINIQPGGSLTIYAAKELIVKKDAKINETQDPEKLVIYGTASFDKIQLIDRVLVHAAIYAPNANTTIQRNAEIFGSVIADKIQIKDDAKFHYDEALGAAGGVGGPTIQYF